MADGTCTDEVTLDPVGFSVEKLNSRLHLVLCDGCFFVTYCLISVGGLLNYSLVSSKLFAVAVFSTLYIGYCVEFVKPKFVIV